MALCAVHSALGQRMMLRQIEFCMRLQVAFEASGWVLTWINNELPPAPAGLNVFASRSVTGFASGSVRKFSVPEIQPAMRARWKTSRDVGVAGVAGCISNIRSSRHFHRNRHCAC